MLASRVYVVDLPGALAIGLFPYGTCMAQLVRGLDVADGPASREFPEGPHRPDALRALGATQCTYPLALGAVVRASSPASSAVDFANALAR